VVIRYPWQKYVDPFALLVLLVTIKPKEFMSPKRLAGVAILALGFLVYVLDTGAHEATTLAAISL
jgi:hypothetical protein